MVAQLPQIWLVLRSAIWDARTPRSGVSERKKGRTARRQWVREKQSRLDDDDEMVWDQATPEHGTRRMLTTEEILWNNQLEQQQPKTSATRAAATAPATPAARAAATARREGGQGLTRKAPAPTPPETLVRAEKRRHTSEAPSSAPPSAAGPTSRRVRRRVTDEPGDAATDPSTRLPPWRELPVYFRGRLESDVLLPDFTVVPGGKWDPKRIKTKKSCAN